MDINTPLGQGSLENERKMIEKIKSHKDWAKISFHETPKDSPAVCDGALTCDEIVAVYESKCRDLTYGQLESYGSWIITYEKLEACRITAKNLSVPLLGFLYLVPEEIILFWKIADKSGKYLFDFETKWGLTQRSINGGKAWRENAYLPLKFAKYI